MENDGIEEMQVQELGHLDWKFETRDELTRTLQDFFSLQGYAIVIKNSHKDRYLTIGCDRGGCYRKVSSSTVGKKERKTGSRLINCPFEIQCKRGSDGLWVVNIKDSSHNHDPSSDMSGHPSCRRLSSEEIQYIKEMTGSGAPPRQILSSLRKKNPNLQAVSRTIYNMRAKLHKDSLGGRTMIQALFEELKEGGFTFDVKQDGDGCLTHIFFSHPSSIALTKSYTNVFVMDCTYKTNKYKMPLLNIIGVTSFNTSFYSCFVFLKKEGEDDYIWALQMFRSILGRSCNPSVIVTDRELALMNAIKVVFPTTKNLLCDWHIDKNILAHCKSFFGAQEDFASFLSTWKKVTSSYSEAAYEETWEFLKLVYKDKEKLTRYITNTWIPFKEYFVKAWTEECTHFGNRVTSRAEGAHWKLKQYLQVSTGDLHRVKNKICLAIENEWKEITSQLSSERIRVPHRFRIPFFVELVTRVSTFAMDELLKQYEMVTKGTMHMTCTGHFNKSMGLPCAHMMLEWKGTKIPLDSIHSQWRIDSRSTQLCNRETTGGENEFQNLIHELKDKYKEWPQVRKEQARDSISQILNPSLPFSIEPNIGTHRGRPMGSLGSRRGKELSSTRRDRSKFEIVEARKCSLCKGVGHNSRTCQRSTVITEFPTINSASTSTAIDLNIVPTFTESYWLD